LTGTIVADLPEEVIMESSSRPSSTISSSTKHKKEKDSEIADAICDLKTSWKDPELSKKKLAMLQKQEDRWDAEQFFCQQDYVLKQQEEAHKQLEEARKAREHMFNEWENCSVMLESWAWLWKQSNVIWSLTLLLLLIRKIS